MGGTYSVNYQNGVMPTNEWFEKIKEYVDFKDKNVVDLGCAEGVMSYLSLKEGAKDVLAIDNQPEMIKKTKQLTKEFKNIEVEEIDINNIYLGELTDVLLLSMIIHWIGEYRTKLLIASVKKVVIIFREPNEGYEVPMNGKWFPTEIELDKTMSDFTKIHSEELMEQDNGKKIRLCIYDRKKG